MGSTLNPTNLAGDFKNIYQDSGLVDAIPNWAIVQDRYGFEESESLGQYYIFGVTLQKEHGATYAPSSGSSSGAQTLLASVAGYVAQVQVEGFAIYMRSRLSYDAAAKASRAGKKAFAQAYGAILKNLKESHQYRLELSLLYGRDGLGIVLTNGSGTLVLTAASWATGIWAAGLKDCILEAFTTTAASATQHNTDLTITSVTVSTKTVVVSGTSAAVAPADVLYFKGAKTTTGYNECAGLYRILTNTGTLFNVDAGSYDAWKAQAYTVGGNLSMTAILQASALGMSYGLEKGLLLCAPEKFAQLGIDEAALRRYVSDGDMKNTKRGVKGVSFQLGPVEIEVMAHPFVKQGEPMLIPDKHVHRVGATDITFGMPGSDEKMEVHVTDTTSLEIRSMSDQGIYIERPAHAVLLQSVT
jgi:hypothetical protein